MMFPEFSVVLVAIVIVAIGTAVQAAIGFGLAMIASPLLYLIEPEFVPGPMIVTALVLSLWVAWHDRSAIDLSHFKAAIAGRLLGTPPAAMLLGSLSAFAFDLLFGSLVLIAVLLSLLKTEIRPTKLNVFVATFISGFMGTISSIGGPPLALVYQNIKGPELRANLSVLFVLGTSVSIIALSVIGQFGIEDLLHSFILLLGVGLGLLLGKPFKQYVDRNSARPILLGLCAMSALMVLGRTIIDYRTS